MKSIIEEIHQNFDEAVDRLVIIADEYGKKGQEVKYDCSQDVQKLTNLGFINTPKSIDFANKINKISETKSILIKADCISNDVNKYNNICPFNKFIYYSQLVNICETYNLVIARADFFIEDIPEKNIKEITDFDYNKLASSTIYTETDLPLFQTKTARIYPRANQYNASPKLYICAPKKSFIKKLTQIGIELFKGKHNNDSLLRFHKITKDPIVLLPVEVELADQIGFIVISKWGLEANDLELTVGVNN